MQFNDSKSGIAIRLVVLDPPKRYFDIHVAFVPRTGEFLDFLPFEDGKPEAMNLEVQRVVHSLRVGHGIWVYSKRTKENLTYL